MVLKSTLSIIFFSVFFFFYSQNPRSPFYNDVNWENFNHKTNIGIYVKGLEHEIKKRAEQFQAKYIKKNIDWHYLRINPLTAKNFLSDKSIKHFFVPSESGTPLNDTMRVNNNVNAAHQGFSPLNNIFSGNGVVMGFIDTGIDFTHDDFKNPNGSTRIIALWDQTLGVSSNTPQPYGYGQHWDSAGINAGLATTHNDQWGHGTTVTGTGTGNGSAVGRYKGVAYEADLVIVEADFGSNFLANVQDATQYIYDIADSLGKPCVINASAGTYFGAHDGADPSAQFIHQDVTNNNGHLFVCSAGNAGDRFFHLRHDVTGLDTVFTLFENNTSLDYAAYGCVPYCYGNNSVHFVGYGDTSQIFNIEMALSGYHNDRLSGITDYFSIQDYLNGNLYQDAYGAYVDSIVNNNNERVGMMFMFAQVLYDSVVSFEVILSPDSSGNYLWGLHTTGNGFIDIWSDESTYGKSNMIRISDGAFPFSTLPSNYINPDSLQTICSSFQCLSSTISVGNYTNDSGYVNNLGNWKSEIGTRGKIYTTSSKGPTRQGILKPDVSASGANTVSSFPIQLTNSMADADLALGGKHYRNGGTSMSSPVVAGVAALYFEKCNQTNYAHFKNDLIHSAYGDNWTGTLPKFDFGNGKLDAFQTLINSGINDTTIQSACDSLLWNNMYYNTSGYQTSININSKGCDSIHVLDLTIYDSNQEIDSYLSCDSLTWIDGITYTSTNNTATYTLANQYGCDSVIHFDLTIIPPTQRDTNEITACDSYAWHSNTLSTSGIYDDTLTSQLGCDSISTLLLTINSSYSNTSTIAACNQFSWEGNSYSSSGIYQANFTTTQGCDSILFLDLTINSSFADTTSQSQCDQYTWNGQTYSTSGIYVDSNLNAVGCDSLNYLNLSIYPSYVDTLFKAVCDSFVWNNNTYNSSGTYTDTLNSIHSCDSVVTYELNVNRQMGSPVTLQLLLDDYCRETRWTMKDSQDSIWYAGGPYDCIPNGGGNQANDTVIHDIYIDANECYTFELIDDYGDGMSASTYGGTDGEWVLTDYNGVTLMQGQGNFGSSITADVHIITAIPSNIVHQSTPNVAVSIYPNPFIGETQVAVNTQLNQFNYQILDAQGKIVLNGQANQNPFTLYSENLSNGIYWLKILNVPEFTPHKLIVN